MLVTFTTFHGARGSLRNYMSLDFLVNTFISLEAQQFPGQLDGPQIHSLPALDMTKVKSSARYEHFKTAAIDLQIAANAEVLSWMLQAGLPSELPFLIL